jgi:hypothetical protein
MRFLRRPSTESDCKEVCGIQLKSFRARVVSVTVNASRWGRRSLPQQSGSPLHQLGPEFPTACEIALGAGIASFLLVRFLRSSGVKDGSARTNLLGSSASDLVLIVRLPVYEKKLNRSSLTRASASVEFSVTVTS